MVIADYHLSNSRFTGYIADGGNDVYFNLTHIYSPDWNSYRYWGYDAWYDDYYYDDYYYARQTRSNDSTNVAPVTKPVRQFGKERSSE